IDEIKAEVMKQVDEDNIRMQVIIDLVVLYEKVSIAKDDMIKAYKECKDIPQEICALTKTFLKINLGKITIFQLICLN
ncbi:hypothetical protein Tco_0110440, partial [Tanacetum coccineum]